MNLRLEVILVYLREYFMHVLEAVNGIPFNFLLKQNIIEPDFRFIINTVEQRYQVVLEQGKNGLIRIHIWEFFTGNHREKIAKGFKGHIAFVLICKAKY